MLDKYLWYACEFSFALWPIHKYFNKYYHSLDGLINGGMS